MQAMSQFSTAGLARLTSRHPWRTIAVWVVILAVAGWQASLIGDRTTSDFKFNTKPESVKGFDLIEEHMGGKQALTETVVVASDTLTVDDPEFQNAVAATTTALRGMPDLVTSAVNYVELSQSADPNAQAQAKALVSADRHATLIPVTLAVSELPTASDEERYINAVESNGTGSVRVLTVGAISSDHTFTKISEEDLVKGEGIGIAAALVVLLVVFGALVAIGLPLALALISIAIATGLASVIASVSTISFFVSNMISMIGLAVGIDYTL